MKQAALVPTVCLQYKKGWDSTGGEEGLEGQGLTARARGPWLEVHGLKARARTARRGLEGQGSRARARTARARGPGFDAQDLRAGARGPLLEGQGSQPGLEEFFQLPPQGPKLQKSTESDQQRYPNRTQSHQDGARCQPTMTGQVVHCSGIQPPSRFNPCKPFCANSKQWLSSV